MRFVDEMISRLKAKKVGGINESIISNLSTQICNRLDSLEIGDSPIIRK